MSELDKALADEVLHTLFELAIRPTVPGQCLAMAEEEVSAYETAVEVVGEEWAFDVFQAARRKRRGALRATGEAD